MPWGGLEAFHWHNVKVHPQSTVFNSRLSPDNIFLTDNCTYQLNHQNWGQDEQQTRAVTKPRPLLSTASKLQTKPASSEQWGREILSSIDLSCLLARISWRLSCHAMPRWQSLQKMHTWNAHGFLTGRTGVLGGERSVHFDRWWNQPQYQPACSSSHFLHARGGSGGPMDKEGRYIGSTFIDRTLMNCLPSVCWWMASPGTQVRWELQKLEKTKGHGDKPRQGHFLGTNAYLS